MNEISRINGINSDYVMGDGGQIVEVEGNPLYMRLFICPYRQPNSLKQKTGICSGENTSCPSPTNTSGHAMVELNQAEGIKLATDNGNQIRVDQSGNILLNATGSKDQNDVVQPGHILLEATGTVKVKNTLAVKGTFTISVAGNTVSLEGHNGAKIVMNSNGSIEIFTAGNAGDVTVRGNLKYTGTLAKI